MKLSAFGEKFARGGGISALMDDLGEVLAADSTYLFMGGGNPGKVDSVHALFAERLARLLSTEGGRHAVLGTYQAPQGDEQFRVELATYLQRRFAWDIGPEHIAVANGSQTAFFVLANLLAGPQADGRIKRLHFPLSPEYVGYGDVGLSEGFFSATRPRIERLEQGLFKYHLDIDALRADPGLDDVAALCVSRPSNPTGNVISDIELAALDELARARDLPLIIDGAYGQPFPGLIYGESTLLWNDNSILMLSLSKLGLPGVRTGILIAQPDIIRAFARANTVVSLASGNLGPCLLAGMLADGSLDAACRDTLLPYYRERRDLALQTVARYRGDLPVWVHRPDGAFFLWLWCENLPIDSMLLYERLKARGVIVLPGNDFFIGVNKDWPHRRECLRVSYAGDRNTIEEGLARVMEELRNVYAGH